MPTVPVSTSNLVTSVNGMIGDVIINTGGGGGGNNDPGYGLIAGGGIVYQGNLNFLVAAAQYVIAGTIYNSPQTSITLDPADASNPRIDIFVFTTSNTVIAVKGTAAAAPAAPSYDPGTQLYTGALVTIPANATSITAATNTLVYDEDTGTGGGEWNATSSGSGWTLNSPTNPLTGTVDILGSSVAAAAYVSFAPSAAIDLSGYQNGILSLPVRVVSAWANKRGIQIQFYSGTATVGGPITVLNGAFNFNSSLTSAYQYVVIPLSQFGIPAGTTVDSFRAVVVGGAISFRLDNIRIQGAAVTGGGNGLTQAQADARYLQLANYRYKAGNTFSGAGSALAAQAGTPFFFPVAGTIKAVILTATDANNAPVSTTAVVDLWIASAAVPTVANTVVASDKPALSAASYVNKAAGSTWTTAVAANSVGIFHIDSNDNAVYLVATVVLGP